MAAIRCPMCRLVNPATAVQCDCGHTFGGEVEEVRDMLAHKLTVGWTTAVCGVLLVGVAFVIAVVGVPLVPTATFISGVVLVVKGTRAITGARRSRKELAARELPRARLLE